MTVSGPCENCGAPLQRDRAHCVICGVPAAVSVPAERAAIEAAGAPRFAIPLPPQIAVLASALALGFGGVIGSALSPGIETILASATAPPAAEEAVAGVTAAGGGSGGSGGSAGSSAASSGGSSTASTGASTSTVAPAPATTAPATEPVVEEEAPTDDGASSGGGSSSDADPTPGDGTTIATGTVVRVNPEAESYSLAAGAAVSTIHAEDLPAAGTSLEVPTVNLFNGTLSEEGDRKESGDERTATFSGTVTYVDEDESLYVLSSAGASIPVRVPAQGGKLPPLSALITVDVEIGPAAKVEAGETEPVDPGDADPGADPTLEDPSGPPACEAQEPFPAEPVDPEIELTQTSFTVDFEELSTASLEGIVQATCPELDQIVVSADDLRELGEDLVLATPKEVDLAAVEPGESVTVNVNPTPAEDGTLELSGIAGDDGLKGADDEEAGQGDKATRDRSSLRLSLRRLFR